MKDELEGFLSKFGVFKLGIADPQQGFEMAKSGCHPRDVMKNCNSVIVFVLHVGLDYYTTLDYCQKGDVESRVLSIYRDWVSLQLANFLKDKGYNAIIPYGFKDEKAQIARLSFKLAAYESGLGVFGRPSILITPEYGPRVNFGVVLTDASIKPDKPLRGFNPCKECDICVRLCPTNGIDKELPPPKGFDRNRCVQFVYWTRQKTRRKIMLCGYCYNNCPVGEISEKTFHLDKWRTLLDLSEKERKRLLQKLGMSRNKMVQKYRVM
jgi:epoxyqueuosine reductase QueG